jgi:hypothetical protein
MFAVPVTAIGRHDQRDCGDRAGAERRSADTDRAWGLDRMAIDVDVACHRNLRSDQ